jgi:hypothetical protein
MMRVAIPEIRPAHNLQTIVPCPEEHKDTKESNPL